MLKSIYLYTGVIHLVDRCDFRTDNPKFIDLLQGVKNYNI